MTATAHGLRVAVVAAFAFAAVACGSGSDGDGARPATTSTGPATSSSGPSSSSPATTVVDYGRIGPANRIGTGLVEGASPDGSAVYVTAVDAALSRPGCEGLPEPVLFRVPLDGTVREALGGSAAPFRGAVVRGSGGRVVLVAGCEEFLSGIRVATETPQGRLEGVRRVEVQGPLTSVTWAADGQSLLGIANASASGTSRGTIVRIDPASGQSTPVFAVAGGASHVGQLADGTYVVASGGTVSLRDGTGATSSTFDGFGFTIAPDRRSLVTWGHSLVLVRPGQSPVTLATTAGDQPLGPVDFSPDGRAIAYVTSVGDTARVAVTTLADPRTATVTGTAARYARVYFTGDGRAVVFSRLTNPSEEPAVLLARFEG